MQLPYIPGLSFCGHCGQLCPPDGTCPDDACESNVPTAIVPILQLPREREVAEVLTADLIEYERQHPAS